MRTHTASWWTLLLAQALGDKASHADTVSDDAGTYSCRVEGYQWRGALYVTRVDCNYTAHPPKPPKARTLGEAVKLARGGDAPIQFRGFA